MRTKIAIKSETMTPFGGIFYVMDQFDRYLSQTIDARLGIRSTLVGYQYSEIIRALFCIYFCGGECVEDVSSYLKSHLLLRPDTEVPSSDTILRGISELTVSNTTYTSERGISYDFNKSGKLNALLVDLLMDTGQLKRGVKYDMDFDHEFLETEKYDAKRTYKHFKGYSPGVAVIGDKIVGIENRDGNANVRFHQADTLERIYSNLEGHGIRIGSSRMDCGSYSEDIIKVVMKHSDFFYIRAERYEWLYEQIKKHTDWTEVEINNERYELRSFPFISFGDIEHCRLVVQRQRRINGENDLFEGEYTYRCILTNDWNRTEEEVVLFYNQRGDKERIFAQMDNDFGWKRLPKSFMNENAVFMLLTAMARNFYLFIVQKKAMQEFGIKATSRIKRFIFKFISVPAKWIVTARCNVLNIYTDNRNYDLVYRNG